MSRALIHLGRVDSTQAFLERHPDLGFCGVLADEQTQGRGRGANAWESRPGAGLWLSAALPRPALDPGLVLQRAMAAVAEVLEPAGVLLGLKWPNDLVARRKGSLVKVGGILGQAKVDRVILGLGVNLTYAPVIPGRTIPPACLKDLATGPVPHPLPLARALLDAWEDLTMVRVPSFRWPAPGDPVRWEEGRGRCLAWLEDGRLRVETPEGIQDLSSGDVSGMR